MIAQVVTYPELASTETFTLEVLIGPVAVLDHSRLAILPSLLVTSRVFLSSEALQLLFGPICYSSGTAFQNFVGFWSRALIDQLEYTSFCVQGFFENFIDPLWNEVIAHVGLTWQAANESVATFSVPGITLTLRALVRPQRSPSVSSIGVPLGSSFLAFSYLL